MGFWDWMKGKPKQPFFEVNEKTGEIIRLRYSVLASDASEQEQVKAALAGRTMEEFFEEEEAAKRKSARIKAKLGLWRVCPTTGNITKIDYRPVNYKNDERFSNAFETEQDAVKASEKIVFGEKSCVL